MGDRANFGFKQGDDTIYLYGHWAGDGMMNTLAKALIRVIDANRQTDVAYATRIAISEIVGEDWSADLGWGITVNWLADNQHSVPEVDFVNQTVSLYKYDANSHTLANEPKFTMPFSAFIERFYKQ